MWALVDGKKNILGVVSVSSWEEKNLWLMLAWVYGKKTLEEDNSVSRWKEKNLLGDVSVSRCKEKNLWMMWAWVDGKKKKSFELVNDESVSSWEEKTCGWC